MAGYREAVGVVESGGRLQQAIDALLSSGFERAELGLLADERTVEEKLGHGYRKVAELEDDPAAPRTAYVSPESLGDAEGGLVGALMYIGAVTTAGAVVASGGTLAGAFVAAAMAGAAGGLYGAALANFIEEQHADRIQRQIEKGGLLLWVRARDSKHEKRAVQILQQHGGQDVHVHEFSAEAYLSQRPTAGDLERALLDPTLAFDSPEEVLARENLSSDQKTAILDRWAYDALQLQRSESEGMAVQGEADQFDRVLQVRRRLSVLPRPA